jgi:ABC-2 type transport system permease protein
MSKILKIAQREFRETIRTKAFIISILMTPVIIVGIMLFSVYMAKNEPGPRPAVKIVVVDLSGELSNDLVAAFDKYNESNPGRQIVLESVGTEFDEAAQKDSLQSGTLDACFVIDKDILTGNGKVHLYTSKPKPVKLDAFQTAESMIDKIIIDLRCKIQNISPDILARIRNIHVEQIDFGAKSEKGQIQSQTQQLANMILPFGFMYLMFLGIMTIGQQLLSSIIEEKNSRIIEVLLSAVSPRQLMTGKIIGLGAVGMTVMAFWALAAFGAAQYQHLNIPVSTGLLLCFLVYYILGFLLFSAILAGVGSICNTIKETQSLLTPIVLIMIIPMITWIQLTRSPDSLMARVMSFIPPLTPMVMVLRLSAAESIWWVETAASMVFLFAAVIATIWAAGKVFKTGILMYGKRPNFKEVFRWLRSS